MRQLQRVRVALTSRSGSSSNIIIGTDIVAAVLHQQYDNEPMWHQAYLPNANKRELRGRNEQCDWMAAIQMEKCVILYYPKGYLTKGDRDA